MAQALLKMLDHLLKCYTCIWPGYPTLNISSKEIQEGAYIVTFTWMFMED